MNKSSLQSKISHLFLPISTCKNPFLSQLPQNNSNTAIFTSSFSTASSPSDFITILLFDVSGIIFLIKKYFFKLISKITSIIFFYIKASSFRILLLLSFHKRHIDLAHVVIAGGMESQVAQHQRVFT